MNIFNAQRASCPEGLDGRLLLDYAVYFEAPLKETIDVCIVYSGARTEHRPCIWGSFQLWLKDFDGRWFDEFWALFSQSQVFRQQVRRFYGIAGAKEKKAYEADLSARMEAAVNMLKALGFPVTRMHIGNSMQPAFVEAELLPREIVEACRRAGFQATPQLIQTAGYSCQPLANLEANQALVQLLSDWSGGSLQPGSHYEGWVGSMRTFSLVPSGIKIDLPAQAAEVKRIVDKSVDGSLGYLDLAGLRSGRDKFSNLNVAGLLPVLGMDSVPEVTASFEEQQQRKVLRWMCRGLPEGLALQKMRIDEISTERQRSRSKEQLQAG